MEALRGGMHNMPHQELVQRPIVIQQPFVVIARVFAAAAGLTILLLPPAFDTFPVAAMRSSRSNVEFGLGASKLADVVVLNKDYFTVPEVEIKQIRSALTIVNGRVVYEA